MAYCSLYIKKKATKNSLQPQITKIVRLKVLYAFVVHIRDVTTAATTDSDTHKGINQRYLKNWADVADKI